MTQRIGAKGQVVIPKSIRDELGLRPGSEVNIRLIGDRVSVEPVTDILTLRGAFSRHDLLGDLLRDHAAEPR